MAKDHIYGWRYVMGGFDFLRLGGLCGQPSSHHHEASSLVWLLCDFSELAFR